MRYIVIENEGIADIRNFTLLGVSSARGEKSKIGQFGSGAKHGILIALRAGLSIRIVTPEAEIEPYLRDVFIDNKLHQQVIFRITESNDGTNDVESSMTLGFGEIDWQTDIKAMLREFISNALDAVGADKLDAWEHIKVYADDQVSAHADRTRVYIEFRDDVRHQYTDIESLFLHPQQKHLRSVLTKKEPSPAKIYRKGVFVRECSGTNISSSLFDYNAGDNVKIDESRKLDSSDLTTVAIDTLFAPSRSRREIIQDVKEILKKGLGSQIPVWEHSFSYWRLCEYRSIVATAVKELWGEDTVVTSDLSLLTRCMKKVGDSTKVIYFPAFMYSWYQCAEGGCTTPDDILDTQVAKMNGLRRIENPTLVQKVVNFLHDLGYINRDDKAFPPVFQFTSVVNESNKLCGFTNGSEIYLAHDHTENVATILEEVAHYYTGAQDFSRDLQDWAFNVAAKLMEERI